MNKNNILFIALMIFSLNFITFSLASANEYTPKYFNKEISIIADVNLTEFENEKRLKNELKQNINEIKQNLKTEIDLPLSTDNLIEIKKQNLKTKIDLPLSTDNLIEIKKQNLETEIDLSLSTDNLIEIKKQDLETEIDLSLSTDNLIEIKKQDLQYDFKKLNNLKKQNTDKIKQNLENKIDLTPPTDNFIENENKLQDEKENENLKIFNENYQIKQLPSQQFLQENIKNDEIKLNQNNFNILKDISKLDDIQENNIENQPIKKSISYLEYIKENPDFENQYIPKKSKYQNNNFQKIQKLNLELTKEDIEKIIN